MKKGTLIAVVAAVVVLGIAIWEKNTYNGLVAGDEKVTPHGPRLRMSISAEPT